VRDGGWWFTLRGGATGTLEVELPEAAPTSVLTLARDFVGSRQDVRPFYAAAAGDAPMASLVRALWGLHHVRFLTLEEIAVYCVMMQRNPITRAAALKRKFLAAFGREVRVPDGEGGSRVLRAMPEFRYLVALDGGEIAAAIGHGAKGKAIAGVVRGVAALGEDFLANAPYAEARDALLEIHGIGPFSAGAILLRGLGRMDELPALAIVEDEGRALYGSAFDPRAIAKRYGSEIGYWSYYVKTGVARATRPVAHEGQPRWSTM
jgi:DNA-3-methyladenine glycosylase II